MYLRRGLTPQTIDPGIFCTNQGSETEEVARELGSDGLFFVECHVEQRTNPSVGRELATKVLVSVATPGLFAPIADPAGMIVMDAIWVDGKSGKAVKGIRHPTSRWAFDKSVLEGVVKSVFRTPPV